MIQAESVSLRRGKRVLFEQASFQVFPGHAVGLVGANGAGKSSLFALLLGELSQDQGELTVPKNWRIAHVRQETPALELSALDFVLLGDEEYQDVIAQLKQAEANNQGELIAHCHGLIEQVGGYHIEARASTMLAGLGFSQEQMNTPVKDFSGGWRMRLNLAQALIARADLLLLDEPTNHLDLHAIVWLEQWLRAFQGTVVIISHDRDFLDGVVSHILHIEQEQIFSYVGNYTNFQRQRMERMEQAQAIYEKEQAKRAHLQSFIDRFRAKASKAKQAQSRIKALEKLTATTPIDKNIHYDLHLFEPLRLPTPLLRMEHIQVGYGDTVILNDVHFNLVPGSRYALLGKNGAGKSTFVKLLAQKLQPIQGEYAVNSGVSVGYFEQHQLEALSLDDSPITHLIRLDPEASEQSLRDYLGRFGFQGDRAFDPVRPFSGGEKARLVLAMLIYQRPNLLLLDEPTNHLDLDMREALIAALQEFAGAIVVVSHDRHFLRATVDDFYLVAEGKVAQFNGDLDDYSQWLLEAPPASETEPNKKEQNKGSVDTRESRKETRQRAAELRRLQQPLKHEQKKIEKHMEHLQSQLDTLEVKLGDPDLYQQETPEQLQTLFQQQAQYKTELEQLEERWFEIDMELEAQH